MYVISIYTINNDNQVESFGMIGTDLCPTGKQNSRRIRFPLKKKQYPIWNQLDMSQMAPMAISGEQQFWMGNARLFARFGKLPDLERSQMNEVTLSNNLAQIELEIHHHKQIAEQAPLELIS